MANEGVFPFVVSNPPTALQLTRSLLQDDAPVQVGSTAVGTYKYGSDAALNGLLYLYSDNPRLAAAQVYENLAAEMVKTIPDFSQDDLSSKVSASAEVLRKIAAGWRADSAVLLALQDDFLIADTGTDDLTIYSWPEGAARPVGW